MATTLTQVTLGQDGELADGCTEHATQFTAYMERSLADCVCRSLESRFPFLPPLSAWLVLLVEQLPE